VRHTLKRSQLKRGGRNLSAPTILEEGARRVVPLRNERKSKQKNNTGALWKQRETQHPAQDRTRVQERPVRHQARSGATIYCRGLALGEPLGACAGAEDGACVL
jgi:hypothetical protein